MDPFLGPKYILTFSPLGVEWTLDGFLEGVVALRL